MRTIEEIKASPKLRNIEQTFDGGHEMAGEKY